MIAPGIAREHVAREQHQQAIREDHFAAGGDHAEAIAVAVEGEAEIGVHLLHRQDQVLQVVQVRRIRMMVREGAVDIAEQRHDFAAHAFEHRRRDRAGDAVAAIDHDLELVLDRHVAGDALDVVVVDVHLLQRAAAVDEAVFGLMRVYSAVIADSASVSPPSTILKPL